MFYIIKMETCRELSKQTTERGVFQRLELDAINIQWFGGTTSQGIAGIATLSNHNGVVYRAVVKLSSDFSWDLVNESIISIGLSAVDYVPNFVVGYGSIDILLPTMSPSKDIRELRRDSGNYLTDSLFMGLNNGRPLKEYLYGVIKHNFTIDTYLSIIIQVLSALEIGQQKKQFTHNDLHAGNVMLSETDPTVFMLYKTYDSTTGQYKYRGTPSYGVQPAIFDYGFSYTTDCDTQPWYGQPTSEFLESTGTYPLGFNPTTDYYKFMKWFDRSTVEIPLFPVPENVPKENLIFAVNHEVCAALNDRGWYDDPSAKAHPVNINSLLQQIFTGELDAIKQDSVVYYFLKLMTCLVPFPGSAQPAEKPSRESLLTFLRTCQACGRSIRNIDTITYIFKHIFKGMTEPDPVAYFRTIIDLWPDKAFRETLREVSQMTVEDSTFVDTAVELGKYIGYLAAQNIGYKFQFFEENRQQVLEEYRYIGPVLDRFCELVTVPAEIQRIVVVDSEAEKTVTFPWEVTDVSSLSQVVEEYETRLENGDYEECINDVSTRIIQCTESLENCNEAGGRIRCE